MAVIVLLSFLTSVAMSFHTRCNQKIKPCELVCFFVHIHPLISHKKGSLFMSFPCLTMSLIVVLLWKLNCNYHKALLDMIIYHYNLSSLSLSLFLSFSLSLSLSLHMFNLHSLQLFQKRLEFVELWLTEILKL